MAPITPGTDGTIQATTAEASLWRWLHWVQTKEDAPTLNPTQQNRISGRKDLDTKLFDGTWSLPGAISFASGKPEISAVPYLDGDSGWNTGTDGTIQGENWAAYGINLILWICDRQNSAPNDTDSGRQRVTATYSANADEWSGTFRLPFTIDSDLTDQPAEYLA